MRYATWTIRQPEGSTPEPTIRANGGQALGGTMLDAETVLGYVWAQDLIGTDMWNLTIKTQSQALTLAQALNPECFVGDDGTIQAPLPNPNSPTPPPVE